MARTTYRMTDVIAEIANRLGNVGNQAGKETGRNKNARKAGSVAGLEK